MVVAVRPLDRASLCALLARYLVGDGVELGPGHSPFPIPYSGDDRVAGGVLKPVIRTYGTSITMLCEVVPTVTDAGADGLNVTHAE